MAAPAAMPPITPAATPQPRQRASAVVGAAKLCKRFQFDHEIFPLAIKDVVELWISLAG